jgi:hypothetical protein
MMIRKDKRGENVSKSAKKAGECIVRKEIFVPLRAISSFFERGHSEKIRV